MASIAQASSEVGRVGGAAIFSRAARIVISSDQAFSVGPSHFFKKFIHVCRAGK